MVEAWINAVWEASLVRNVRATDPEFEKYKCPIFLDMYITCSNLKRAEKEHMKELITKHGKQNIACCLNCLVLLISMHTCQLLQIFRSLYSKPCKTTELWKVLKIFEIMV